MNTTVKPERKPLLVFESNRESKCGECGSNLGRHAWITLQRDKGALCLECADLDHLVFLPPGDATLTRRATKESRLIAVVLKRNPLVTAETARAAFSDGALCPHQP